MSLSRDLESQLPDLARRPRQARVRVGISPARGRDEEEELGGARQVCVLGFMPSEGASPERSLAALGPALVRWTRVATASRKTDDPELIVAHLQLRAADRAGLLPGLDGASPSLLRDTVEVALRAGAPAVEVVLIWPSKEAPLWSEVALGSAASLLEQLPGALLLVPDLLGGATRRDAPGLDANLDVLLSTLGPLWARHYQVLALDLPTRWPVARADALLRRLAGADVAVCAWEGEPLALERQGWRSAAAVVAGVIASRESGRGLSVQGVNAALPPPRYTAEDRVALLSPATATPPRLPPELPLVRVLAQPSPDGWRARVLSEPTLRRPHGAWPLPALIEAKEIHRLVMATASRFVFESVDDEQAIALSLGLRRALRAQIQEGLLVGPSGVGPPEVRAFALPNPAEPGLSAVVSAQLRPWAAQVSLRLAMRPNSPPTLDVV
ncbi:MAG: hypothetical protein IPN01_26995 [Deltaproteobacteria bacterium]|nr:hypothetical protein [Deltaproteobacteria bacterium]